MDSCVAILLYNPKNKHAALKHLYAGNKSADEIDNLLDLIKDDKTNRIHVHLVGGSKSLSADKENNEIVIEALEDILIEIGERPNLQLKTFDAYDKPKPITVAIDSRNGRLYKGEKTLSKHSKEAKENLEIEENVDLRFHGIECDFFDGTIPTPEDW